MGFFDRAAPAIATALALTYATIFAALTMALLIAPPAAAATLSFDTAGTDRWEFGLDAGYGPSWVSVDTTGAETGHVATITYYNAINAAPNGQGGQYLASIEGQIGTTPIAFDLSVNATINSGRHGSPDLFTLHPDGIDDDLSWSGDLTERGGGFIAWVGELKTAQYHLYRDVSLAPVPVPAAGFLLVGGLGVLALRRRRHRG